MEQLYQRMVGAAKLNLATFREVEEDTTATMQAAVVVVLVAVASGIGNLSISGPFGLLRGILAGLFGWALLAALTYWIGTRLLALPETKADWGQLARTLAFAQSPGILFVLGVLGFAVSFLGSIFLFLVSVWVLIASVIAVREALDYGNDTIRAFAVVILAYIPYILVFVLLSAIS